jgi:hypothetical protein
LRGLSIEGADTGVVGIRITGAANSANSAVFIEQCIIDGDFGGAAKGISDERSGGGELYIADTTVRNTNAIGVAINPLAGSGVGARIDVSIDNVRVQNSTFGLVVSSGARAMVTHSIFSGNSVGLDVDGPLAATEVNIEGSVTSNNIVGIQNGGGTATIRLSNTDVAFNGTAITGATQSYGNNRISGSGNGGIGTAPTLIGSAAPAMGQQ